MRRLALAVLVPVIAACASRKPEPVRAAAPAPRPAASAAPAAAPEGSLATKESKTVARTLAQVSKLRGIPSTRPVPGVKLARQELVGRVKEKALREYPPDALRREGQLLQMFGFAPTSFDYLTEMMKLLESQLEGFYEPQNGTMYLAADLRGKEAQATLAHELVHALQDQAWDLKSRSTYRPGKGDETLALACLAEGDATSLMMDFVMAEKNATALDLPNEMVREMMTSGMAGGAVQSVPHILRTSLIAPYVDGLDFVHALRRKGGWPMVDTAWGRPPVTTEQVLHLEKWEQHEAPIAVAAPSAKVLGAGWKMDDEDTFGELGFALTFEEWVSAADARTIAAGWGGDRSAIYTNGEELAFAIHERYDPAPAPRADAFAERAIAKLAPALRKRLGRPAVDGPEGICFERKDFGPLMVARRDRELVVIAGPARAAGGTWTSSGTCAVAKRWADEIATQK